MQSKRQQKKLTKLLKQDASAFKEAGEEKKCWCGTENNFKLLQRLASTRQIEEIYEAVYKSKMCGTFTDLCLYVCSKQLKRKLIQFQNIPELDEQETEEDRQIQRIKQEREGESMGQRYDFLTLLPGRCACPPIVQGLISVVNKYLEDSHQNDLIVIPLCITEGVADLEQRVPLIEWPIERFRVHGRWPLDIILAIEFQTHYFMGRIKRDSNKLIIEDSFLKFYKKKMTHLKNLKISVNNIILAMNQKLQQDGGELWVAIKGFKKIKVSQQRSECDSALYLINNIIKNIKNKKSYNDDESENDFYRSQIQETLEVGFLQYRLIN